MEHFPKHQRKISLKVVSDIYRNGSVIFHYPYKAFYQIRRTPHCGRSECKVVTSVPKRNFKHAVDRNRIKRQIRESFRLNYSHLQKTLVLQNVQIDLLCLYLPNELIPSSLLAEKMESLLERLSVMVTKIDTPPSVGID